jgi:glycosyltransferase involved in cell wall biosynthesis
LEHPPESRRRVRIALVCHSLAGIGGTQRVVSTLSTLLSPRFEVFELSFDPAGTVRGFDSPARFVTLGPSLQMPLPLRPLSYLLDAIRLRRAKKRLGIEVSISNLWRADLLSVLSMGGDRKISICHINIAGNRTNRLLMRFRGIAAAVYRRFHRVVSVSHPLGVEIAGLFALDPSKCAVIHNCVAPRGPYPAAPKSRRVRVAWCGRFVPEKNVLSLVEVFAQAHSQNPALQLLLIGDGPLRKPAEARVRELGLASGTDALSPDIDVVFTGVQADPAETFASCDFQVLPSIDEGLGMVLIEGFAVGIPAIASDCRGGGVHDALGGASSHSPGRTAPEQTSCGFLLPVPDSASPETIDQWRSHILLMAADTSLRGRLAAGAKARALAFAPGVIAPQWFRLLAALT